MRYKYESPTHLKNMCAKILRNKEMQLDDYYLEKLNNSSFVAYEFDSMFESELKEFNLRGLSEKLSWEIKESKNIFDVEDAIESVEHYVRMYRLYFLGDIIHFEKKLVEENCLKPSYKPSSLWHSDLKKELELSGYVEDFLNKFHKKKGLYFLYDQNEELLYVGKSNNCLATRALQSMRDKNARFFKFTSMDNEADVNIYEMYFISKLKPLKNKDGASEFEPSFELPEIAISKAYPVYKEDEK